MTETPRPKADGGPLRAGTDESIAEPTDGKPVKSRRPLLRSAALVLAGLIIGGGTVATVQAVADDDEGHRPMGGDGAGRGFGPGGVPGGVPGAMPGGDAQSSSTT